MKATPKAPAVSLTWKYRGTPTHRLPPRFLDTRFLLSRSVGLARVQSPSSMGHPLLQQHHRLLCLRVLHLRLSNMHGMYRCKLTVLFQQSIKATQRLLTSASRHLAHRHSVSPEAVRVVAISSPLSKPPQLRHSLALAINLRRLPSGMLAYRVRRLQGPFQLLSLRVQLNQLSVTLPLLPLCPVLRRSS